MNQNQFQAKNFYQPWLLQKGFYLPKKKMISMQAGSFVWVSYATGLASASQMEEFCKLVRVTPHSSHMLAEANVVIMWDNPNKSTCS